MRHNLVYMQQDIDFAHKVFVKISESIDRKLENGLKLRESMRAAIDRGEIVDNYRADWLKATAVQIINTLHLSASNFNEKFTEDRISLHDLMDALATAMNLVEKAAED